MPGCGKRKQLLIEKALAEKIRDLILKSTFPKRRVQASFMSRDGGGEGVAVFVN